MIKAIPRSPRTESHSTPPPPQVGQAEPGADGAPAVEARLSDVADARLPGLGVPRLTRPTRFARPATATRRPRAAAEVFSQKGFRAASIIYLFVYLRFIGKHRWPAVIAMSLLIPITGYYLFEHVLQVGLPRGIFELPYLG